MFQKITEFTLPVDSAVLVWQTAYGRTVKLPRTDGDTTVFTTSRYPERYTAGTYRTERPSTGIVYLCASDELIADYRASLEMDGFPIPSSLRVTGLDRTLSTFGIERGRLYHMYKVGKELLCCYYSTEHLN